MSDHHAFPLYLRFWPKVDASGGPNACWEWTAGRSPFGYGKIRTGPAGDPDGLAHRISWEMFKGPIPPGLMVLHVCDNPPCVNPSHLFLGDALANGNDCKAKGRSLTGSRHGNAKLTEEQVREIKSIYAARGGVLQRNLHRRYGISQTQISRIVRGESWTHVPEPCPGEWTVNEAGRDERNKS